MPDKHQHQWSGYVSDSSMLACTVPGCNTMARIRDLLDTAERRGILRGRFEIARDLLKPTAMLTKRGRKALNSYIAEHPLTHQIDIIQATQVRLIHEPVSTRNR